MMAQNAISDLGNAPSPYSEEAQRIRDAAPDLLTALVDLMPTITCMERHGIRYDPAQVDAAHAAIRRATMAEREEG